MAAASSQSVRVADRTCHGEMLKAGRSLHFATSERNMSRKQVDAPQRAVQNAPPIIVAKRTRNLARADSANETGLVSRRVVSDGRPDVHASDQPTQMPDKTRIGPSPTPSDETSRLTDAVRVLTAAVEKLAERLESWAGNAAPSSLPPRREARWTRGKTEGAVKSYLATRQADYDELATRVLVENDAQAAVQFAKLFGPSAIAQRLSDGCRKQYVERTPTYRAKLKPLIRRPAQFPRGWTPVVRRDSALEETIGRMRRLGSERT